MRVIAGRLGSRPLQVAPKGVRPTTDRVRESLFAGLGDMDGARVLDLFAGTGALGIEALSRGAAHAVFVEKARASLATLRKNLATLELADASRVVPGDALRVLPSVARSFGPFDLVFVDPPYEAGLYAPALAGLADSGALRGGGAVVVERAKRNPWDPPDTFRVERERTYGDIAITQLRPAADAD